MARRTVRTRDVLIVGSLFVAVAGYAFSGGLSRKAKATEPTYSQTLTNCRVVDGDTLRCDGGRVRLLGIDAPELPGHCAQGRDCAPGDPFTSTASLRGALGNGASVPFENVGTDRYGRTLAMVKGQAGDLSCWQLSHGAAIYKPRWDNGGRVAGACPSFAR